MFCLRSVRAAALSIGPVEPAATTSTLLRQIRTAQPQWKRTLTTTPLLTRPRLPATFTPAPLSSSTAPIATDTPFSSAFTRAAASPGAGLLGSLTQMRGAIRDTYNNSHRVRKRRLGFLARLRTRGGRKVLQRRRARGRHNMSH